MQRVAAARVGPAQRKGDLVTGSLLQQELAFRVEQEDAEGAMQHALLNLRHLMTCKRTKDT